MRHTHENLPRPLSAGAIDYRRKLAASHTDADLRNAVQRVRLGITPSEIPPTIRNFLTDCGRREPHNSHPMGRYPAVAMELAERGTPFKYVIAPLTLLRSKIAALYKDKLPPLDETQHTETNANCAFDHAQLAISDGIVTEAEADAIADTGNQQISATEQILARVESLRGRAR